MFNIITYFIMWKFKMKTIKIKIVDPDDSKFMEGFLIKYLSSKYNIEFSDNPVYLFYSVFGNSHHKYDCIRIFYTGENVVPNFNYCDYAWGFNHLEFEDRYMRLPLWRLYENELNMVLNKPEQNQDAFNRKFCAMVVSNTKQTDGFREEFFEKLNQYKQVDSGGKYKNNVGGPVDNKVEFQKGYKFSLAFENIASRGYCTEKILESFASCTIPIYYGDETVVQDFNPKAFINCHDYKSIDEVIERIKQIDNDPQEYLKILNEPVFKDGKLPEQFSDENIAKFLLNIFDQPIEKAVRRKLVKPYMDVDYLHMKRRDSVLVMKQFFKNAFLKLIKKK